MKTLYESILDDEDTLIGNSIKDSQNPFTILANLSDEDWCKEDIVLDIIKQLEFPKYVLQDKVKVPFNKDCLGVKITSKLNEKSYIVTYDREKILNDTPVDEKRLPVILCIKIFKWDNSESSINDNVVAILGYNFDMKVVFGGSTPVQSILKKWSKKYNIKYRKLYYLPYIVKYDIIY